MSTILLAPPFAFAVYLVIAFLLSRTSAAHTGGMTPGGSEKAYACGEDMPENISQPDYSQFFPFAFFFTIMHVIALVIATVPHGAVLMPLVYLAAAATSIFIIFRR